MPELVLYGIRLLAKQFLGAILDIEVDHSVSARADQRCCWRHSYLMKTQQTALQIETHLCFMFYVFLCFSQIPAVSQWQLNLRNLNPRIACRYKSSSILLVTIIRCWSIRTCQNIIMKTIHNFINYYNYDQWIVLLSTWSINITIYTIFLDWSEFFPGYHVKKPDLPSPLYYRLIQTLS